MDKIPANVPILSKQPKRKFACLQGHSYEAPAPLSMKMQLGNQVGQSGPFCPICYLDWFGKQFPTFEVHDADKS